MDRKPKLRENFTGGPVDIVITTPMKLQHYLDNKLLQLSEVSHMVVDEADTLMDESFGPHVRELVTLLNSAEHRRGERC